MANNQELQVILREALRAYEHARTARLHAERQAKTQLDRTTTDLATAEQTARRDLEAAQRSRLVEAGGEQARLGDLAAAVTALEEGARTALAQAGLAHIAGAPTAVDGAPAKARRGDAEVTALFVQAQTGYVALREAIYRLAAAQVDAGQWEQAQQTLQPLLADKALPIFRAAFDMQRASYVRPAQQALAAGQWEEVRAALAPWLKQNKDDAEAQTLMCESYYRPGADAFGREDWATARTALAALNSYRVGYKDASELERASYLRPAQEAFKSGDLHMGGAAVRAWVEKHRADRDAFATEWRPHLLSLIEWVEVAAGDFLYGDNKQRQRLSGFRMSRTPITNAQYDVYVQFTGGQAPGHWTDGRIPVGQENDPVVNVSWDDAQAFCRWAGLRLPTEQEWEKGARGTDGRAYPWGDQRPSGELCNFNNIVGDTTPVGRYPQGASPYGLLDMAGNVWEWCQNVHEQHAETRVIRGGAYNSDASWVGCASRVRDALNRRLSSFGFRVVRP